MTYQRHNTVPKSRPFSNNGKYLGRIRVVKLQALNPCVELPGAHNTSFRHFHGFMDDCVQAWTSNVGELEWRQMWAMKWLDQEGRCMYLVTLKRRASMPSSCGFNKIHSIHFSSG